MIRTKKQELFVKYYVECKNATKAALMAGYHKSSAHSSGHRLLKDAEIKQEIERRFREKEEQLNLTEAKIIEKLCYEAQTAPRPADRIRALEILAKIRGMLKESQQTQTIAVFEDITKKIKDRIPEVADEVLATSQKEEKSFSEVVENKEDTALVKLT